MFCIKLIFDIYLLYFYNPVLGLDVIWTDWKNIASNKKLQARLYGFADCVTMWDTIEHYVPMKFRNNVEKQNEIYEFLFDTVKSCFKEGIVGRAWTSCLHIRSEKNVSFAQKFNNFILDKFHSGYYPEFESRYVTNSILIFIYYVDDHF